MSIDVERLRAEIEADPSSAIAGLSAFDTALTSATRDRTSDVDVDTGGAFSELALLDAEIAAATRDREVRVDVDRSRIGGATGSLGGLSGAFDQVTRAGSQAGDMAGAFSQRSLLMAKSGGFAVGMVQGLGGAFATFIPLLVIAIPLIALLPGALQAAAAGVGLLYASIAPLVGLVGLIMPLIGGFAVVLGTLGAALIPVFQGVSAYKNMTEEAAQPTQELANRQQVLADSARGLEAAYQGVTRAQEALAAAREALAKGPHDAAEALEDQHFATKQAVLSEKQAVLALRDAQKALAQSQEDTADAGMSLTKQVDEFTGKSYDVAYASAEAVDNADEEAAAKLRVRQAELDLARARDNILDQQRALREMEKDGIKNSDIMVDRRRAVRDAEWALESAQDGVTAAMQRQTEAQERLNEAVEQGTPAMQAWADAQKNLSGEGKDFVKFLADDFIPGLRGIAQEAQKGLVPGVQRGLEMWLGIVPKIEKEARIVGNIVGDAFEDMSRFWTGEEGQDELTPMFRKLNGVIRNGVGLLQPLSEGIVDITDAAAPALKRVFKGIGNELDRFNAWADSPKGKKAMEGFFNDAVDFGGKWWDVLKPISSILGSISKALKPMAGDMLEGWAESLEKTADYLASPEGQDDIRSYVEEMLPTLQALGDVAGDLVDLLFNSSKEDNAFLGLLETLRDDAIPAMKDFFDEIDNKDMGQSIGKAIAAIVEAVNLVDWVAVADGINSVASGIQKVTNFASKGNKVSDWLGIFAPTLNPLGFFKNRLEDINDLLDNKVPRNASKTNSKIMSAFGSAGKWLGENFIEPQKKAFGVFWDSIGGDNWRATRGVKNAWSGVKSYFKDVWFPALKEDWRTWKDWLKDIDWIALGKSIGKGILNGLFGYLNWDAIKAGFTTAFGGGEDGEGGSFFDGLLSGGALGGFVPNLGGGLFRQKGGPVQKDQPVIVGEKRPELFVPSTSGRVMPRATPSDLADMGGSKDSMSAADIERIVRAVMDGKSDVNIEQTFNEKVDPHHVAKELAWSLR